jgi:hypothetical protein
VSSADEYYLPSKFYISNVAYHKHKGHFDSCLGLFRYSEDLKDELSKYKIFTNEQRACSLIFVRCQSLLISILKLCNEGNLEDAGILLRSLFEHYVDMKYIIKTECGKRFYNFAIIYRYDFYIKYLTRCPNNPEIKTAEFKEFMDRLTKKFELIKDEYIDKNGKIPQNWAKHDLRCKAEKVGEDLAYEYIIKKYSTVTHCNIVGMKRLFREDESGFEFYSGPTIEGLDEILVLGENIYGNTLTELFGVLGAPLPERLKKFVESNAHGLESAK